MDRAGLSECLNCLKFEQAKDDAYIVIYEHWPLDHMVEVVLIVCPKSFNKDKLNEEIQYFNEKYKGKHIKKDTYYYNEIPENRLFEIKNFTTMKRLA